MANPEVEKLKRIARRWITEGWSKGDVRVVDELHAPDFVDRDPSGREPTNAGFKKGIEELYGTFPDFSAKVEDLVVESESGKAAILWSATGTHKEDSMSIPPTGKKIRFKGIEIITIKNGKITERWGEWGGTDILQQLGAI